MPAAFRGDNDPDKQFDPSHFNQYLGNTMDVAPDGSTKPNGMDFWWDCEASGTAGKGTRARPE